MKHSNTHRTVKSSRLRTLIFSLMSLLFSVTSVNAQEVSVIIEPLTQNFPSQLSNYLDNPFRYARVRVVNNTAQTQQIYLTLQLTAQMTQGGESVGIYSQDRGTSRPRITIAPGGSYLLATRESFTEHFSGRLTMDLPQNLAEYTQLPEGTYRLCVQANRWSDVVSVDQQMAEGCLPMNICYTGSAPEFTAPIIAGMGGNTSITPQRNINIRWNGVITNCASSARFRYILKIVQVLPGQNALQAISRNPVFFSQDCGNHTYCVIDTLRDLRLPLQRGATYAMQVMAVQQNAAAGMSISLSNDGNSQVVVFSWGESASEVVVPPIDNDDNDTPPTPPSPHTEQVQQDEANNQNAVLGSIKMPVFTAPAKANADPQKHTYVPVSEGLHLSWTSVKGDSVKATSYILELYEDNLGGTDPSLVHSPLKTKTIQGPVGYLYTSADTTSIDTPDEWKSLLVEGGKYLLKLRTHVAYTYRHCHYNRTTHYVNGIAADTEVDSLCSRHDAFTDTETSLRFQWGIDSSSLIAVAPSQFVYPVNRSSASWNDTSFQVFGLELPEIDRYDDFELLWSKPKGLEIGDSAVYTLYIYEMPKGKELDQVLKSKPKYTIKKIQGESCQDTILDSLEVDKGYVMQLQMKLSADSLKYNLLGGGKSHPIWFKLTTPPDFSELLDTKFACFPNDTAGMDRVPVKLDVQHLIRDRVRLKLGRFDLIVQAAKDSPKSKSSKGGNKKATVAKKDDNAKKDADKKDDKNADKKDADKKDDKKKDDKNDDQYSVISGEGYVLWHPLGFGCGLKVKFDTIRVNKDNRVIGGSARTITTDTNNYLNLNIGDNRHAAGFDMFSDKAAVAIDKVSAELGKTGQEVKKWYDYINTSANVLSENIHGAVEGEFNLGVLTTPVRINDQLLGAQSKHLVLALNDCFFTPLSAHANYLALFNSHEDNLYVPFLATNVCIDSNQLFSDTVKDLTLVLAQDYSFPLPDGYTLTFNRPTKLSDVSTGTHIAFDHQHGFKHLALSCQVDFGQPGLPGNQLLAVDVKNSWAVDPSRSVKGHFSTKIEDWDNWTAAIHFDPFTIVGCEDYTFIPSGNGILYDHSDLSTPKEVRFPSDYLKDPKNEKERNQWQGFYLDQFQIVLPPSVSTVFVDYAGQEQKPQDKPVYHYGANGQLTDSVDYLIPASRISFGADALLWDKQGLSVDVNVANIISLETKNGGGWLFSLDTVGVRFQRSAFKEGRLVGRLRVPFFTGNLRYNAQLSSDSIAFKVKPAEKNVKLDLFLADIDLNEKSSYFTVVVDQSGSNYYTDTDNVSRTRYTYLDSKSHTRLDLTLNGTLNINFDKIGLDANIPALKFEKMYLRNFTRKDVDLANKAGKNGKPSKNIVKSYQMGPLDFSMGTWSKASPQKYLGAVNPPPDEKKDDDKKDDKKDKKITGKAGGLEYSIDTIDMTLDKLGGKRYRPGIAIAGQMKFGIGAGQSVGASAGFTLSADVDLGEFKVEKVEGKFDSVRITTNIGPLNVDGFLAHTRNDSIFGNSWRGALQLKVLKAVDFAVSAGFGTSKTLTGTAYDWWFLEGALALNASPFIFGPLTINGFGGGFAYNMITANHGQIPSAEQLMAGVTTEEKLEDKKDAPADKDANAAKDGEEKKKEETKTVMKSITGQMVHPSGLSFKPQYDAWVAKAGISFILTGSENTLSAVGQMNLRMANGHFAGITMQMTASVMGDYNHDKKKAGNSVLNAAALIDFVDYSAGATVDTGWALSFSFCAKSDLRFDKSFLASEYTEKLTDGAWYPGCSSDRDPKTGKLSPMSSMLSKYVDEEAMKEKIKKIQEGEFSASATMRLPVDLYVRNYGKSKSPRTKQKNDWYFALGRPEYEHRISFSAKLDLTMIKASTEWTAYLVAGNAPPGGLKLPELPAKVKSFFENKGGVGGTLAGGALPQVNDPGGFALGMSFESHLTYDMFLYLDVNAYIGFDAALLYSKGMACEDGTPVGRNNFYAMGQAYAMLDGKLGLSLDLGFWKGQLTLAEAGIGALLQAGGPNPTWCYGLLGFSASILGGVATINTKVDFSLGHVCIPGASDPLANVKLFQSVTPGYAKKADAQQNNKAISPLVQGVIVSNLPWNEDVLLCAQERGGKTHRDRKFRFVLEPTGCYDFTSSRQDLNVRRARTDANTLYFEDAEGSFTPGTLHELHLRARAFELRTSEELSAYHQRYDHYFNIGENTFTVNNGPVYPKIALWRNPTFAENGQTVAKLWSVDTVLYFQTQPLPPTLYDQVVFTWPYNGDPYFPINEIYHDNSKGRDVVPIFLYTSNSALSSRELSKRDERLKAFLLKRSAQGGIEIAEECDCEYLSNYEGTSTSCVLVTLPRNFRTSSRYANANLAVRVYRVKNSDYDKSLKQLMDKADQSLTYSVKSEQQSRSNIKELQQRLNQNKRNSSNRNQQQTPGQQKATQDVNLERTQLQTVVQDYNSRHDTTLNYQRKSLSPSYQATVSSGSTIYSLYFHTVAGDYKALLDNYNLSDMYPSEDFPLNCHFYTLDDKRVKDGLYPSGKVGRIAYLFCDYDPDDAAKYHTGTVLPPIMYMALDIAYPPAASTRLPEYQLYEEFSRTITEIDYAIRNTKVPSKRPKQSCNSGTEFCGGTESSKVWYSGWQSATKRSNVQTAFYNGLVDVNPGALWLPHTDLRIVDEGSIYTNMTASTRHIRHYSAGSMYPAATLLWFEEIDAKKRIDSAYFESAANDAPNHMPSYVRFIDGATPSILKDIEIFGKFYHQLSGVGLYTHDRPYSSKIAEADFIFNRPNNRLAVPDGVPFTIPKSALHSWYFNMLNATVQANINYKKELIFKESGVIDKQKLCANGEVNYGKNPQYWQDYITHFSSIPFELDRKKGSPSVPTLFYYNSKYRTYRTKWWDDQGGILSYSILQKYRMFNDNHDAYTFTYWRTLRNPDILKRLVRAVKTREADERLFLANQRRRTNGNKYYYSLASDFHYYERCHYLPSTSPSFHAVDWFEK